MVAYFNDFSEVDQSQYANVEVWIHEWCEQRGIQSKAMKEVHYLCL